MDWSIYHLKWRHLDTCCKHLLRTKTLRVHYDLGLGLGLGSKACATLSGNDLQSGALIGSLADTKLWRPRAASKTTILLYPVVPIILCPYLHWDPSSLFLLLSPLHPHYLSWWLSSQFLSSLLTHPLIVLRIFREHLAWVIFLVAPGVFFYASVPYLTPPSLFLLLCPLHSQLFQWKLIETIIHCLSHL